MRMLLWLALAAPPALLAAMPAHADPIITPILISVGVSAAVAPFVSAGISLVVGLGLSLISSTLFAPAQPKPSDGQTIIRQSSAARFRSYGRVKVGGVLMFANSSFGVLDRVIALGSGEIDAVEEHWIDDQLVTVDGSGNVGGKYSGHCVLEYRLGTDSPVVYSSLQTAYPSLWTANHLGKGIPSAHMQMFQVPSDQIGDLWPNLANTMYRQVQRSAKIAGVSGGALTAPVWSENAALIILDYLIHPDGLNLSQSWIENEIESWGAAQLVCEEAVALAAGGTEARYRIGNTYRFDERPADVLARYLQACDAQVYPTPNRGLAIRVGKWEMPTVTIDDDAIVAFSEVGRGRDVLTTANLVRARFMSPDHDYQETDAEPWTDDADIAARGEFPVDLDLFSVPSHSQCRRLMKVAAHRANPNWVGTLVCNLRALPAMGERFVNVQCPELGIDETFEILSMQFLIEGTILKGLQLSVESLSSEAYDWDPSEEEGTGPGDADPITGDNTLPSPTGFGVSGSGAFATLVWDAFSESFLTVQAQYKATASSTWLAIPVTIGATSVSVGPLPNNTYEFQIRTYSTPTGRVSAWTASENVTISVDTGDPVAPDPVSGLTAMPDTGANEVLLQWTAPNSGNFNGALVYRNTADDFGAATLITTIYGAANAGQQYNDTGLSDGTYYYWVTAANGSGVESAETATGAVAV